MNDSKAEPEAVDRVAVLYEGATRPPAGDTGQPGDTGTAELYGGDYAVDLDPLAEAAGDQAQEVLTETQRVFRELSLTGHEANTAAELVNQYGANPADEIQRQQWQRQVVKELKDAYPKDWRKRLDRTMERVNRNDNLVSFLEYTGLGDHPDVVRRLVEQYGDDK